jgi:hypothetical protein
MEYKTMSLSNYFGIKKYYSPEAGMVRDYIQYLSFLQTGKIPDFLTESNTFGLGCGLSYTFRAYENSTFYFSTINEALIKDALANINIKAWFKTEPDTDKFIAYISGLLDLQIPVITYLEHITDKGFFVKHPVVILSRNNSGDGFLTFDYYNSDRFEVKLDRFKEASSFKETGAIPSHFWFEIAMPEQFFPLEKSMEWAIVKNVQAMLYPGNNSVGVSAIQSLLNFIEQNLSEYKGEKTLDFFQGIDQSIQPVGNGAITHLNLFIDFLQNSRKILQLDKLDTLIPLFNQCQSDWKNFYMALHNIGQQGNKEYSVQIGQVLTVGNQILENTLRGINGLGDIFINKYVT